MEVKPDFTFTFTPQLLQWLQGTSSAIVLAQTGERPLWAFWLLRATRLWNHVLAEQPDSPLRQAVLASARQAVEQRAAPVAAHPSHGHCSWQRAWQRWAWS